MIFGTMTQATRHTTLIYACLKSQIYAQRSIILSFIIYVWMRAFLLLTVTDLCQLITKVAAFNLTSFSLAAFSWHFTFLLMSAYDHVHHLHHHYLLQPTVIPCQPQASFSLFQLLTQPHQKLLFFFCAVTSCVLKRFSFSK